MITDMADALDQAGRHLGVDLTVIDHLGRLYRDGVPLVAAHCQSHRRHPVCDDGFGPECIAHCRCQVNLRLAARPGPLATRCWKGVREVAVPIRWREHHLGTLFCGRWRQASRPRATDRLGEAWLARWRALPPWRDAAIEDVAAVAQLLADGIAGRLGPAVAARGDGGDPARAIAVYIHFHAHLPVAIGDLAEHLGRSVSRTRALVRRHCGMPFAHAVRRRRLETARHLLATTRLPIAAVAGQVGYDDPAFFSRVFRQAEGCSPRAWRQRLGRRDGTA